MHPVNVVMCGRGGGLWWPLNNVLISSPHKCLVNFPSSFEYLFYGYTAIINIYVVFIL